MSNLELRIEEEASLNLTLGESSDMSFDAVDFVGVPFAPTVEVEDIEGGHRVSITSMGAEGKKTDEFDVMDGADGATGPQGPKGDSYEITSADYAAIAEVVEEDIQDVINAAQDATADATAAAAEARAASAATWLSGNVLFGELAESTVLTADDVYTAPPKGVSVFGKSTQAGTPTPSAPVPILSVDDLTLVFASGNLLNPTIYSNVTYGSTTYYTTNADGSITVHASDGRGNSYVQNTFTLRAGTYTVSRTNAIGNWGVTRKSDGVTIAGGSAAGAVSSLTFTLDVETEIYIKLSYLAASGSYPFTTFVQLQAGDTATSYTPYVAPTTIPIPLSNHVGRSLPDGTRDTLTLSYEGPAQTAGYGIFRKTLTQNVQAYDMGDITWTYVTNWRSSNVFRCNIPTTSSVMCTAYPKSAGAYTPTDDSYLNNVGSWTTAGNLVVRDDSYTTVADFTAAVTGQEIQYALATPITHDLGTIELPILPCPLTAWADGGSAQPTMQLEYERALSIVIPRIEAAISDLATS